MNFGTLDIIFAVIIVVAAIRCLIRGFIAEVLSMAALLLGLAGAVLLMKPVTGLITRYTQIETAASVIAFLAVFIIIYIIVKISEGLLHRIFEALHLEKLDRALGFILGIIEGLLLCGIVIFLLSIQPFIDVDHLLGESFFVRIFLPLIPTGIRIPRPGDLLNV